MVNVAYSFTKGLKPFEKNILAKMVLKSLVFGVIASGILFVFVTLF